MAVIHRQCFGPPEKAGQPAINFSFTLSVQFKATMKLFSQSLTMIRHSLLATVILLIPTANAAELSPWMGSDEQAPFQLDPNTMVAVTFAADPLHTGSISTAPCKPETESSGCIQPSKTAKTPPADSGTPQN
jgi:hypothetical protein